MKLSTLYSSQGNRCGHDPRRPRIGPDQFGQGGGPEGLSFTAELAARWFHQPQNSPVFRGPGRQTRRERREACLAVLRVILKHLDSQNCRVGLSTEGDGFIGLGHKTIAQESSLGMRRGERAIALLKAAGLISSTAPFRSGPCPGHKHASHRVVLMVNPDFLKNLVWEQERLGQNPKTSEDGA